ncbi:E3 ORF1 [reindeer adenovirus 1]|uniref:E3 ORF1 n=1 Tax=reindeer adenovirus 1 TaxID=2885353 RepID=A0AAE8Y531_9ADEN|nr:E3 ORF1 [reindeer adenovirus 1]
MKGLLSVLALLACISPLLPEAIHLYAADGNGPRRTYVCDYGNGSVHGPNLVMWMARNTQGSWLSLLLRHNGSYAAAQNITAHFTDHNSTILVSQYYLRQNALSKLCCSTRHNNQSQFTCTHASLPICHQPGQPLHLQLSPILGGDHESITWMHDNRQVVTVHRPWGNVTWHCPVFACFMNATLDSLVIYNFSSLFEGQYTALIHTGNASLFQLFLPAVCAPKRERPPARPAPPRPALPEQDTFPASLQVVSLFILCTVCCVLLGVICPPLLQTLRALISAWWNDVPYKPII